MNRTPIHIDNYEAWLLDLAEGNLSAQEEQILRDFAVAHPELEIDFNDLELFYLDERPSPAFDFKTALKQTPISADEADFILFEGLEDTNRLAAVEQLLFENPIFTIDYKAFAKTKLVADGAIKFEAKIALKRDITVDIEKETAIIEALELNADDTAVKALMAKNPGLEKTILAYQKTKLQADTSIIFEGKLALKHALVVEVDAEFKIAELVETGSKQDIKAFIKNNPAAEKDIIAYQKTKLSPDLSIVYTDKAKSKKPLFVLFSQTTMMRVAAILVGVSVLGWGIYQWNDTVVISNTNVVADNVVPVKDKTIIPSTSNPKKNVELEELPTQTNKPSVAEPNVLKSTPILANKINASKKETIKSITNSENTSAHLATTHLKPTTVTNDVKALENVPQKVDDITTVQLLNSDDITVAKAETESRKATPVVVLEDIEEATETDYQQARKDPLLYKAANEVNKLLTFIGTKNIPVEKKEKKNNVSYKLGKSLFSYSKNKKLQP